MTTYVLVISLGPVQELIAAARKCRDLWFGSWLLSELSKATAAGVVDALDTNGGVGALVFPAPSSRADLNPGSPMSVANKLVARVTGGPERVQAVAEQGRSAMLARLRQLRDEAFDRIGKGDARREHHFRLATARAQVEDLYDVIWVAVPEAETNDKNAYANARKEAERLLSARKNTRAWSQPAWGGREGVPKSSLDGVRESVLHEEMFESSIVGPRRPASLTADERRRWYGVHKAERLCGVGLLKRWGVHLDATKARQNDSFVSTAHMAALPLLIGVRRRAESSAAIKDAFRALLAQMGDAAQELVVAPEHETGLFSRVDGALLFPERLAEALEEYGFAADSERTKDSREALRTFLRIAADRAEPIPYYAILVADGDNMGRLIQEQDSPHEHRDFSRKLDEFARGARTIVEKHDGCLIYSGGDDVLALLPIHTSLSCAHELASDFKRRIGATLSAGLAIVHYAEPLDAALALARRAEKDFAKNFEANGQVKNAVAVALAKRGGATTFLCDRWDALVERIGYFADLHEADAIADKAGYELAELARLGDGFEDIQRAEATRILRRKRAQRGNKAIEANTLNKLEAYVGVNPRRLGDELVIAGFIAKARKQAQLGEMEGE